MKLIECVPNISDGQNPAIYQGIAAAAASVPGVKVLHVDPGFSANRTVITFVGSNDAILQGAWQLAKVAIANINMQLHTGTHARIGALDVMPFIPLLNTTIEECVTIARTIAMRLGNELGIPTYLYEAAASKPDRSNLADIRKGEYEGLAKKLFDKAWQPDFGPATFIPKTGAAIVGARKLLIAYNINLDTQDAVIARRIARDLRERSYILRGLEGNLILNASGSPQYKEGLLPSVKAIGWYAPEYSCAQVSMNLLDITRTPLHIAYDTCVQQALDYGVQVTGSEIVGLVSKDAMIAAGKHYLARSGQFSDVLDAEAIEVAIDNLGLNKAKSFNRNERIIEYCLEAHYGSYRSI
ncbi:MAG: glutamate formimidoyltransferase [Deltaproteobacteria bacterium]|nr:glutamate formimidoyltransferase [Deltaproteobacteria bacterium]